MEQFFGFFAFLHFSFLRMLLTRDMDFVLHYFISLLATKPRAIFCVNFSDFLAHIFRISLAPS